MIVAEWRGLDWRRRTEFATHGCGCQWGRCWKQTVARGWRARGGWGNYDHYLRKKRNWKKGFWRNTVWIISIIASFLRTSKSFLPNFGASPQNGKRMNNAAYFLIIKSKFLLSIVYSMRSTINVRCIIEAKFIVHSVGWNLKLIVIKCFHNFYTNKFLNFDISLKYLTCLFLGFSTIIWLRGQELRAFSRAESGIRCPLLAASLRRCLASPETSPLNQSLLVLLGSRQHPSDLSEPSSWSCRCRACAENRDPRVGRWLHGQGESESESEERHHLREALPAFRPLSPTRLCVRTCNSAQTVHSLGCCSPTALCWVADEWGQPTKWYIPFLDH